MFGLVALRSLAIDLLPEVDSPRITITVAYEGVAPLDIETLLTRPIEEACSTVDGIRRIEGTSTEGLARVQLEFAWGMDLEESVNEVRAQLERIRPELPEGADPPMVLKFDLSSASVAHLGISGSGDARRLRHLAEEDITRRLEAVPGVAKVDVRGGRRREIRVELVRDRLDALSIRPEDVSTALARENRDVSAGDMLQGGAGGRHPHRGRVPQPRRRSAASSSPSARAGRSSCASSPTSRDGVQEIRDQLSVDEVPGIRLMVSKQSDANTIEVVHATAQRRSTRSTATTRAGPSCRSCATRGSSSSARWRGCSRRR